MKYHYNPSIEEYKKLKENSVGKEPKRILGIEYKVVDKRVINRIKLVAASVIIAAGIGIGVKVNENRSAYNHALWEANDKLIASGFNMHAENIYLEYEKLSDLKPFEVALVLPTEHTEGFLRYNGYSNMDEYAKANGYENSYEYRQAMKKETLAKMKEEKTADKDIGMGGK